MTMKKSIILLIVVVLILLGYIFFYKSPGKEESYADRLKSANEILDKDCDGLSNITTEYIKNDLLKTVVGAVVGNRCDCIKNIIAPKLAAKYPLSSLEDFKKQPIHQVIEIKEIIHENSNELKKCNPFN